jgi:hypothetical protein
MDIDVNSKDFDILNPDLEVSKRVFAQLQAEVCEDLKKQLSSLENLSDLDCCAINIDSKVGVRYLESLGMSVSEEFESALTTIPAITNYIRYNEQERMLNDLLSKYLTKLIPELDLKDPCKFIFKKNFSNIFIIYKEIDADRPRLDALEIKYFYDYDTETFSFKIVSPNGALFAISLKQLRMLLDLDNNTSAEITDANGQNGKITIILANGNKIII